MRDEEMTELPKTGARITSVTSVVVREMKDATTLMTIVVEGMNDEEMMPQRKSATRTKVGDVMTTKIVAEKTKKVAAVKTSLRVEHGTRTKIGVEMRRREEEAGRKIRLSVEDESGNGRKKKVAGALSARAAETASEEVAKEVIVPTTVVRAVLNVAETGKRRRGAAWVWIVNAKMKGMPATLTVGGRVGPGEIVHEGAEGVGVNGEEGATAGWTLTAGWRTDGRREDRRLRLESGT